MMASVLDIEGVASLALLSDGGISGHLIDKVTKKCHGILGKGKQIGSRLSSPLRWAHFLKEASTQFCTRMCCFKMYLTS
jgi:hypothetical protein